MRTLFTVLILTAAQGQKELEIPPWWDVAWSTWALVFIGGLAAWIALRTLRDIKKQTINTTKAADAALLNAQAIISSERAWIMVELEWVPACPRITHGASAQVGVGIRAYTSAGIRFKYTNEGKTIAWIEEKLACFQILKELPKKPNLSVLEIIEAEPEWVGSKREGHLDRTLEAEGQEGMEDISVVWGVIRYRDAFGNHETTFGFHVLPDCRFERLTGLPEYNKTT
jgi:hypothetical protein